MKEIIVAFDGGTSCSKVVASYPSPKDAFANDEFFSINSGIRQLTKKTYESLSRNCLGKSIGLNKSLVSFIDPKGKLVYWEIGENTSRLGLLNNIKERKFEGLIVKLLAFIGYLVNKSKSYDETLALKLGILLPLDEIEDRQLLANWLREIINHKGFSVNGTKIDRVSLEKIDIKPEGFGLYKNSGSVLQNTGVLMMGHGDCSWLYFGDGYFYEECSRTLPSTGMHELLSNLKFPIQEELVAARAIALAGKECVRSYLGELVQTKSDEEYAQLVEAIVVAREQYWQDRQKDFESLNISWVDSVVVGGGAAYYFSDELKSLFKEKHGLKIDWNKNLKRNFCDRFALKSSNKIANLFLDCYGYFQTLSEIPQVEAIVEQPALKIVKNEAG